MTSFQSTEGCDMPLPPRANFVSRFDLPAASPRMEGAARDDTDARPDIQEMPRRHESRCIFNKVADSTIDKKMDCIQPRQIMFSAYVKPNEQFRRGVVALAGSAVSSRQIADGVMLPFASASSFVMRDQHMRRLLPGSNLIRLRDQTAA